MRTIVFISIILAILALILPIALSTGNPITDSNEQETSEPTETASPTEEGSSTSDADETTDVRVSIGGEVQVLTMSDYLIGVVAAEMPASFDPEALKAQAIAARTYTLYKMLISPSDNHPDADVCSDSTCCKAYIDTAALKEKWGNDYETYLQKITDAVSATDGICLLYGDEPILAVFHSSSAGQTETSEAVWGSALPYLQSVESTEKEGEVPNYVSSVEVSLSDFIDTVKTGYPDASFGDDPEDWITDITYTDSGRINTLTIGGVNMTGPSLRSLFGLRSTAADIEVTDESITFITTGYGHGVGMSQYGANSLAKDGYDYTEILNWYYTGIEFGNMTDLF